MVKLSVNNPGVASHHEVAALQQNFFGGVAGIRLFILLPFLGFILLSCSPEAKQVAGPDGSWWLGGADGGVFVRIEDDANPEDRLYQGAVYFENGKKVWYKGEFRLVGDIKFSPADHGQYQFWDGEKLYLQDSSYLQPTAAIPKL